MKQFFDKFVKHETARGCNPSAKKMSGEALRQDILYSDTPKPVRYMSLSPDGPAQLFCFKNLHIQHEWYNETQP